MHGRTNANGTASGRDEGSNSTRREVLKNVSAVGTAGLAGVIGTRTARGGAPGLFDAKDLHEGDTTRIYVFRDENAPYHSRWNSAINSWVWAMEDYLNNRLSVGNTIRVINNYWEAIPYIDQGYFGIPSYATYPQMSMIVVDSDVEPDGTGAHLGNVYPNVDSGSGYVNQRIAQFTVADWGTASTPDRYIEPELGRILGVLLGAETSDARQRLRNGNTEVTSLGTGHTWTGADDKPARDCWGRDWNDPAIPNEVRPQREYSKCTVTSHSKSIFGDTREDGFYSWP